LKNEKSPAEMLDFFHFKEQRAKFKLACGSKHSKAFESKHRAQSTKHKFGIAYGESYRGFYAICLSGL